MAYQSLQYKELNMYYALFDENKKFIKWINLQLDYPNISFPTPINHDDLPEGVYGVIYGQYPTNVEWDEVVEIGKIPKIINGVAILDYVVNKLSDDDRNVAFINMQLAARNKRNGLLQSTDFEILKAYESGISVPDDLKTYRQQLRDIPSQEGFPLNIVWPNK